MQLGPTLETKRLILRPPVEADLDGWEVFAADAEVMRFLGGQQTRAAAWRSLATMTGSWALRGFGMFSVIEKSSGQWIGRLGPWMPEGWPGTEIGWGLTRSAWGKGYAMEGTIASIDWAFAHLGWTEVIHTIDPDNEPSKVVARRLGARMDGFTMLPAPFDDKKIEKWVQSRRDWELGQTSRNTQR